MNTTITVSLRDVYGKTVAYPACDQARRLAELVGTTTLTGSTLLKAKRMGFDIVYRDHFSAETRAWSGFDDLRLRG